LLEDMTVVHNTSIAMNMAENIAITSKMPVAVFSMEMPGDSLAMRMMSSIGRIDQHKVRTGKLEEDEWPRLTSAINILAETKIFIDDTPALTPTEVRSRSRRLARDHGQLGLIVLDYIQLMHSPSSGENRVQQVGDISRGLKALAKEMNVPVVALSQLNRNLEQRTNKRPVMSDLRESGCLTGDSLVTRADTGARVAIKDLLGKKDFSVWALNEKTLKLEATPVNKVFATGIKPVFRLTTKLGRTISATANHKFYTSQGWRRLDDLTDESYLTSPKTNSPSLMENDIKWDKIVSIEAVGEETVYDLTVPRLHNFVVNDIIAHNSIEQDADLIVFVYRDEVYDENSPDKGIAEIIIGKQRNGPLGTTRLTFLGQYTKFENYTGDPHRDEDYE